MTISINLNGLVARILKAVRPDENIEAMKAIVKYAESMRMPSAIVFTLGRRNRPQTTTDIDASNPAYMFQIGRAIAHLGEYELLRDANTTGIAQSGELVRGYILRQRETGREVAALLLRNKYTNLVARVYERENAEAAWHFHKITQSTTAWVMKIAKQRDPNSKTPPVAWTKYHILAMILNNRSLSMYGSDHTEAKRQIREGFQREAWRYSGHDHDDYEAVIAQL